MQSFISDTLDDIIKSTSSFDNVEFILPSQRAGVFVKQALKNKISAGFLPKISTIGNFIEEVAEIKKIDTLPLLFHFYSTYIQEEKQPDSFDTFSSWAITVLQDFNEIDQHLIAPKEIFLYIRDVHRLKKWSVSETLEETPLMKDHYNFLEKLHILYDTFYLFLTQKKVGYQGVIYREATKKIDQYITNKKNQRFFIIGFNALNTAEEFLFQRMLKEGNTSIYWDIDESFYTTNHAAGSFIRKYQKQWKHYRDTPIKTIANHFSETKNIQIIGAPKNISQIKYAGEILASFPSQQNTALVLGDESLLPITLNSLPENISAVNITMGYPLKDIPTASLLERIFKLFQNQEKLQKSNAHLFYYKDVIALLRHPSIYRLSEQEEGTNISDKVNEMITKSNTTFVSESQLAEFFKMLPSTDRETVLAIFKKFSTVEEFLTRITNIISLLKESSNELEKEYLYRFYGAFEALKELHKNFNYIKNLKTLQQFFKQLIQAESLSFQGEPLQGLQLMGVLETRVLDFENVILTSINEGILPGNHQQNSFIPFDAKIAFGLPTHKEKDALFSYHFFRLLQRAKNVYILYNTEPDVYGSGEKSRFITQLQMLRKDIKEHIISPKVISAAIALKEVSKTTTVTERLKELAKKGISPSALTTYLRSPFTFYKQKILKVKEFDNVEETVAANTMGTIVHDTLEALYKPFVGNYIRTADIDKMYQKSHDLVAHYFTQHYKNGSIHTGKNRLIFEVANRFVTNFLNYEKKTLDNNKNQLKIIATEQTLVSEIEIEGINFPIKIHGQVDRIDEFNGITRIIDYKTGKVTTSNLKVANLDEIGELKYHKALQVMLYSFLYQKNTPYPFTKPFEAGVFSFRNFQDGFIKMNFSKSRTPDHEVTSEKIEEFIHEIKQILLEIYNPEIPFSETGDEY